MEKPFAARRSPPQPRPRPLGGLTLGREQQVALSVGAPDGAASVASQSELG